MRATPLGPIAGAYYLDDHRASAIVGPVGSGKSTASCLKLQRLAYAQRPHKGVAKTRWAIVRNTTPQLKDTTLKTWLQVFPEVEYGEFQITGKTHHWKFTPRGQSYKIDAEFMFRALDDEADVANLLGLELTGLYFNELREMTQTILANAGRRAGRFPSAADGGCSWHGWTADSNAWDVDHYLYDQLVENPREGWKLFVQPGGMDPNAENLENLSQTEETLVLPWSDPKRREQGRKYYLEALQDYTADDAHVYVHNKWGRTRSGKPIYTEYIDSVHCKPFELAPGLPLQVGYDFGRTPAALIGQETPFGWRIRHELCAKDMGVKAHGALVAKFIETTYPFMRDIRVTGDPAGNARDGSDHTAFDLLSAAGLKAKPAHTNELSVRIEAVQQCFRRMSLGEPGILIHPECKQLRRACIDGYRYRKLSMVGERYSDDPDKNEFSHPAEALQYLLMGGGEARTVLGRGGRGGKLTRPKYCQT
jgi:Terminase large subunit, T4likevirus-type, N-terminal